MAKIKVQFESGESRYGYYGVNFLLGKASDGTELYSEVQVEDGCSEDYGYIALKNDIIEQAKQKGITDDLVFQYDGQEQFLAPDAWQTF